MRFTINCLYLVAINVSADDTQDGDWYTTITHGAEKQLPFGDNVDWSDITRYGEYPQVVTQWAQLI